VLGAGPAFRHYFITRGCPTLLAFCARGREGGDFDFGADARFLNIKVPTLSRQKERRQGWGNPDKFTYPKGWASPRTTKTNSGWATRPRKIGECPVCPRIYHVYDSFGNLTVSGGTLVNAFRYTGREFDPETDLYFYRARYYDPTSGRFISEDPIGFRGGNDFYRYVHNRPIGLGDPMGLSPSDVQRIQDACKKCTQGLTATGLRRPGSGLWQGFLNDQLTYWNWLRKTHLMGCKSQATLTKSCLENPTIPYDNWRFSEVPWWLGFHTIVAASSSDPNDPVVYCDPWRNYSWTDSATYNFIGP
jgi:RHS repeat-associated protein